MLKVHVQATVKPVALQAAPLGDWWDRSAEPAGGSGLLVETEKVGPEEGKD